jgi:hypothetical protein
MGDTVSFLQQVIYAKTILAAPVVMDLLLCSRKHSLRGGGRGRGAGGDLGPLRGQTDSSEPG